MTATARHLARLAVAEAVHEAAKAWLQAATKTEEQAEQRVKDAQKEIDDARVLGSRSL